MSPTPAHIASAVLCLKQTLSWNSISESASGRDSRVRRGKSKVEEADALTLQVSKSEWSEPATRWRWGTFSGGHNTKSTNQTGDQGESVVRVFARRSGSVLRQNFPGKSTQSDQVGPRGISRAARPKLVSGIERGGQKGYA